MPAAEVIQWVRLGDLCGAVVPRAHAFVYGDKMQPKPVLMSQDSTKLHKTPQ